VLTLLGNKWHDCLDGSTLNCDINCRSLMEKLKCSYAGNQAICEPKGNGDLWNIAAAGGHAA
jgi:hypothetical protein